VIFVGGADQMMDKIFKLVMLVIMIVGVCFSILNFLSVEVEANVAATGSLYYGECFPPGSDCKM
jgi:hypothetical protein